MLSDQEIIRRLRAIKFSPQGERYARRAPSLNAIVQASGVTRQQVYQVISGYGLGPKSRARLSRALTSLEH